MHINLNILLKSTTIKIHLFLLYFYSWAINCSAQTWQKCYGGTNYDYARDIKQTNDGGYIVVGETYSSDGDIQGYHQNPTPGVLAADIWIVKIDSLGFLQWQKCLGGSNVELANAIQQTNDNGYIIAGSARSTNGDLTSNRGDRDYWIIKLNSFGNIEWQKCYGSTGGEEAFSVLQTNDNGFVVVGFTNGNDGDVTGNHGTNDIWVLKLNSFGIIEWQKCLGGQGSDAIDIYTHYCLDRNSVEIASNGDIVIASTSGSNDGDVSGNHGQGDIWVVRLNPQGNIVWQHSYGGSIGEFANAIKKTSDGGFVVVGYSQSNDGMVTGNHGQFDYWLIKLNSNGVLEWQKSLGGSHADCGEDVQQTRDGGYILSGIAYSNDGDISGGYGGGDYWIVKLNSIGNIQWQSSLGGNSADYGNAILQANDGGYIVAGATGSNNGNVSGSHGSTDFWVVKLNSAGTIGVENLDLNSISIHPNPFDEQIYIDNYFPSFIVVKNQFGQTMTENSDVHVISTHSFLPGIYFVEIFDSNHLMIRNFKMIKVN